MPRPTMGSQHTTQDNRHRRTINAHRSGRACPACIPVPGSQPGAACHAPTMGSQHTT
ncbi:hypothetical protein ACQKFN_00675 [Serratia sp. NPDC071084]|uniref:hypothetical protein n=1 Tax=Serratia sp. NPDC071084 TaxID=3390676 RepID=UPI003D01AB3C